MQVHSNLDAKHEPLRTWMLSRDRGSRLLHDCVLPMRTSGLLYVVSGALLITFSQDAALPHSLTATMLFEDESVDFAWLHLLPGCVVRSISNETNAVVIDEREQPQILSEVASRSSALTARLSRQLISMTALSLENRLTAVLIKFGGWVGHLHCGRVSFDFPVSRDSLAGFIGVRPETLSRAIRQAEKNELISLRGWRHVEVQDWTRLCGACPISAAILASLPERRTRYLDQTLPLRTQQA